MAKRNLPQTTQPGALEKRPDFIETSTAGTEDIASDELKLPMLRISQGLSPQMLPDDSARIEGLELFQMFNDLSEQIYGKGPITFLIGRRDVKRIEFDPDDRKIPIDLEVPASDPRMNWTKDDNGKGVPPRASKFVEFLIAIVHSGQRLPEPIVLSIQESNKFNKKAHARLSGFIKMRQPPAPIYAGLYTLSAGSEKNDKGTFGVPITQNAGFIQDPKLYQFAKQFHESLIGKVIDVNREAEGDTSFNTDEMDQKADDPFGM